MNSVSLKSVSVIAASHSQVYKDFVFHPLGVFILQWTKYSVSVRVFKNVDNVSFFLNNKLFNTGIN